MIHYVAALTPLLLAVHPDLAPGPSPDTPTPFEDSTPIWDGVRWVQVRWSDALASPQNGLRAAEVQYRTVGPSIPVKIDDTVLLRIDLSSDHREEHGENSIRAMIQGWGLEPIRPLMPSLGLWLARSRTGINALDETVRLQTEVIPDGTLGHAMPNFYFRRTKAQFTATPRDPLLIDQWYFQSLDIASAWALTTGDPEVTVVVVDNGCDLQHPDLVGKLDPGLDVVDDDDDPSFVPSSPGNNHGTACAGLVAADSDNEIGITGTCPDCRLRCVRLLGEPGEFTPLNADVEAFEFALQVEAAVISNSWGFVDSVPVPGPLADAINNVYLNGRGGLGAVVVFAAGNDNRELVPGELYSLPSVLTVGAINSLGQTTQFTNFGPFVDVVAPVGTFTTDISGPDGDSPLDYTPRFGGTSSACPIVAGLSGLLAHAAPDKSAAELKQMVIDTAALPAFATPDENGHDAYYGRGTIDPTFAVQVALGLTTVAEGPLTEEPSATPIAGEDEGCRAATAEIWGAFASYFVLRRRRRKEN